MDSLLQAERKQLRLIDDNAIYAQEEREDRTYTASRLFSSRPETYEAIVRLSAEGLGAVRIGKLLQVSAHTVLAVRAREGADVATERIRLSHLSRAAARLCIERMIDMLADPAEAAAISPKDLAIMTGILVEKSELLSGGPTHILRVTGDPGHADLVSYLEGLRMDLSAGSPEQKGAPDLGPAAAGDVIEGQFVEVHPAASAADAGPLEEAAT